MTRYEHVQEAIRLMEHHVPREDVRDFLLVADVPDHLDPSGVVHVDATRAVLDWFCARHPDHPICLASASRQNTRRAWEAFGYAHLPREYARLRLLDLNAEPLPEASFTMHLTTQKASSWGTYLAQPRKMYTPRGHIWHRSLASSPSLGEVLRCPSERRGILKTQEPHLTIVVQ